MNNERNFYFKLLLLICSLCIAIEIGMWIWSNSQVSNLRHSEIEAIQLAKEGCVTLSTVLVGNCITIGVSALIPQYGVCKIYNKVEEHKYYWIAKMFYMFYILVPIVSSIKSVLDGYSLIRDAGTSLFKMIS